MEPGEERKAPDLRHFLGILRRRRWAFLVCVIAVPAAAFAISKTSAKTYQVSVLMQVQGGSSDQQLQGQQQAPSASVVDIDSRLIQTSAVAAWPPGAEAAGRPTPILSSATSASRPTRPLDF